MGGKRSVHHQPMKKTTFKSNAIELEPKLIILLRYRHDQRQERKKDRGNDIRDILHSSSISRQSLAIHSSAIRAHDTTLFFVRYFSHVVIESLGKPITYLLLLFLP